MELGARCSSGSSGSALQIARGWRTPDRHRASCFDPAPTESQASPPSQPCSSIWEPLAARVQPPMRQTRSPRPTSKSSPALVGPLGTWKRVTGLRGWRRRGPGRFSRWGWQRIMRRGVPRPVVMAAWWCRPLRCPLAGLVPGVVVVGSCLLHPGRRPGVFCPHRSRTPGDPGSASRAKAGRPHLEGMADKRGRRQDEGLKEGDRLHPVGGPLRTPRCLP